ncbi:MAG: hypothetical protein V7636_1293 [Actinomycetota bacterium]
MSGLAGLDRHLEEAYGFEVTRLTALEPWAPDGVQRVDRAGGVPWVARVSPVERSIDAAEGDAEILRFLAAHDYPAERCADEKPVTVFDGRAVIVTELVAGTNARSDSSTETFRRVGALNGLLHSLPVGPGAVSRPAGGWHHVSINGGGRRTDVDALLPVMDRVAAGLSKDDLSLYGQLRDELEAVDGCEDLPHALVNIDLGGPNVIVGPDGSMTTVDWTGSGRGPRVHAFSTMSYGDLARVDAFVAGYREHATLDDAELDRLADALPVHSLVLDCWMFAHTGRPIAQITPQRAQVREHAKRVADRARQAVRS